MKRENTIVAAPKALVAFVAALVIVGCFGLVACGGGSGALKDGTYTAQSEVWEDEDEGNGNGYGVITITITDGAISDCEFKTYEPDGTLKDSEYGKSNAATFNQDFYNRAQRAVAACDQYAENLVAVGAVDAVDTISGATISHNEFVEAANLALDQARE